MVQQAATLQVARWKQKYWYLRRGRMGLGPTVD